MPRVPHLDGTQLEPLFDRASTAYAKAFDDYIRYGEPIDLRCSAHTSHAGNENKMGGLAEERPTTHYIWRTRGDGKVRPSHAENDGKIFAWDDPPPTGHPGEDYGCRCTAIAYVPDTTEFFNIEMQNVSDLGPPWSDEDFVWWYFLERGRGVTVRQTGYLRAVADEFRRQAGDVPTGLPGQIADAARLKIGQNFSGEFDRTYQMQHIVFSLGNTTISGRFSGNSKKSQGLLELRGTISFELKDEFRDPFDVEEILQPVLDKIDGYIKEAIVLQLLGVSVIPVFVRDKLGLGSDALDRFIGNRIQGLINSPSKLPTELPYGVPYKIIDRWRGTFSGRILIDASKSEFKKKKE